MGGVTGWREGVEGDTPFVFPAATPEVCEEEDAELKGWFEAEPPTAPLEPLPLFGLKFGSAAGPTYW